MGTKSPVCVEHQGVDFDSESGHILLLKLTYSFKVLEINNKFRMLPVRCLLTKVVFPVPPSPTSTSLKVGMSSPVAMMT